jgi:hypothetical protein
MPLAVLLNPDDPIYAFEHAMQTRQYFAVMERLFGFSILPYLLDPSIDTAEPAGPWNLRHQQSHTDFNRDLPSNYADGYTTEVVQPPTPPPPPIVPPPPPYVQANPLDGGTFGIPQAQILLEGNGGSPENRSWWTFVNHQQHFTANNAILPLPTDRPLTAGTPPGVATVSNPWWWTQRAPVEFPFW